MTKYSQKRYANMARDQGRASRKLILLVAMMFALVTVGGFYGYRSALTLFGKMLAKDNVAETSPVHFEFYTALAKQQITDTQAPAVKTAKMTASNVPIADQAELERQLSDMVEEKRAKQ